jgi:predicted membrane protein
MRSRRSERGEGNFGCIVGLIFIVLAVFVAYKVIPAKANNAELKQVIVDEAKSAGTHNDGVIKEAILRKARDNSLPVTEDDVKIVRNNNEITVDVEYTMPIAFPGYTYQWNIHHHVNNPIF